MRIHDFLTIIALLSGASPARAAEPMSAPTPETDAAARYQAARACLRGEGVAKDVNKAFALMKSAAEQGNADAIGGLGYFYSVGVAVPKDENLAAEWFRKGAEKGSAKAQFNLGMWLLGGHGGAGHDAADRQTEAMRWIRMAADQSLPEAALAYGRALYGGEHGVTSDYQNAARYFKIAADAGDADARNFLGVMSELGWGGPMDRAMAERWFRQAALQGHPKAQSNLGRILGPLAENKETRIEALAWLLIASDQGEVTAGKELADNVTGLKDGELDAAKARALELRKLIRKETP